MNTKAATFSVTSAEILISCPHCASPARPAVIGPSFLWNIDDIRRAATSGATCLNCKKEFPLPAILRKFLLRPSSEPLSSFSTPRITETEIICGDCSGEAQEPHRTLLTIDNRCSACGGQNHTPAAGLKPVEGES